MDAKDIIRMAREAANGHPEYHSEYPDPEGDELEVLTKFANLVALREREACAKVCDEQRGPANGTYSEAFNEGCHDCAVAIRERSNAKAQGREPLLGEALPWSDGFDV